MSSNLNYKQSTNVERRTWDRGAYEARAKARTAAAAVEASASTSRLGDKRPRSHLPPSDNDGHDGQPQKQQHESVLNKDDGDGGGIKEEFTPAAPGAAGPVKSERAFLKARRKKVDLESKVGTTEIVSPDAVATSSTASSSLVGAGIGGGSSADGITKSATGVGWHCKVCDCFLKDSLTYLDHINGRKHQRALGYSMRAERSTVDQVSSKLAELAKAKKKMSASSSSSILVGGSNKNNNDDGGRKNNNDFEDMVRAKDEEALRRKAERARRREERKKREEQEQQEAELEGGIDPDIAAMMGFSGFAGGNKNR